LKEELKEMIENELIEKLFGDENAVVQNELQNDEPNSSTKFIENDQIH